MSRLRMCLGFLWTLPSTLLGLLVAILGGAKPYALRPAGAWYWVPWQDSWGWGKRYAIGSKWGALTLGHITIVNPAQADNPVTIRHERFHLVRQYWVWGPLFLPVYLIQWMRVRCVYRDIPMEVAAYAAERSPDAWG